MGARVEEDVGRLVAEWLKDTRTVFSIAKLRARNGKRRRESEKLNQIIAFPNAPRSIHA
jgi:hypothetical protein